MYQESDSAARGRPVALFERSPLPASMSLSVDPSVSDSDAVRAPAAARGGLPRLLRTRHTRLFGQGLRFALAGSTVALVYLLATTLLAVVAGLPFQAALAIGFCLALAVNFTLQRSFVWTRREDFALPLRHQIGRYLLAAGVQYGITAAIIALLPPVVGLSSEIVYLATVALMAAVNFLVSRNRIFHIRSM